MLNILGLSSTQWPGRCQKLSHNGLTFYLDGAHTEESIDVSDAKIFSCVDDSFEQLMDE